MRLLPALVAVSGLALVPYVGVGLLGWRTIFNLVIPYAALALFIGGFIYRMLRWAKVPVPFRIPTTCGQQRSLPWIEQSRIENPSSRLGVIARMALEVLLFRSLARNTSASVSDGNVIQSPSKWLWIISLVFHWAALIVVIRHLRLFTDPVPAAITAVAGIDGFLQIGVSSLYLSGLLLLLATSLLFARRLLLPQVRYISQPSDYFFLLLIGAIASTGIALRLSGAQVVDAKAMCMGLVTFAPIAPGGMHWLVSIHLFLVSTLFAAIPFSKLMHAGGIFLSPTRNMANNSRAIRHENPWNHPVPSLSYEEYEDEFREKMIKAGIPVEKE